MLLRTEWEHSLKRDFEFAPMATPAENTREIRPSNITDQSVMLHARQIRAIFDSVTNRIIELVEHQVNEVQKATGKPPRTILVVGGFGRCRPFIRGALKFEFDGRSSSSSTTERGHKRARTTAKNDIHILSDTGDMPWAAICRGAVLAKLEDNARLESRKARFSLGFPQSIVASTDDNKREGQWDSLFGCHMVPNVMTRILKRVSSLSNIVFWLYLGTSPRNINKCSDAYQIYREIASAPPTRSYTKCWLFPRHRLLKSQTKRSTRPRSSYIQAKSRQRDGRSGTKISKNGAPWSSKCLAHYISSLFMRARLADDPTFSITICISILAAKV